MIIKDFSKLKNAIQYGANSYLKKKIVLGDRDGFLYGLTNIVKGSLN